ncbi:MAG TPA: GIY-YIG nuclease family protein, partial [Myxococcaceae bacterium]|nr:GIY-YIG nuclease family protein [Myxococcaceae bacterium]
NACAWYNPRIMLYLIRSGRRGALKIGYTADRSSFEVRLLALQIGNPEELKVIALVEGSKSDERSLHRRFESLCIRSEWYRFSVEIRDWFDAKPDVDAMERQEDIAAELEAWRRISSDSSPSAP